jgi:prevent-host-death family protein
MAKTVTIHAAKTQLSKLLAEVEAGEVVIIARDKTPIAQLVPVTPKIERRFGAMRGQFAIGPEFFDPLPDEEIAAWEN